MQPYHICYAMLAVCRSILLHVRVKSAICRHANPNFWPDIHQSKVSKVCTTYELYIRAHLSPRPVSFPTYFSLRKPHCQFSTKQPPRKGRKGKRLTHFKYPTSLMHLPYQPQEGISTSNAEYGRPVSTSSSQIRTYVRTSNSVALGPHRRSLGLDCLCRCRLQGRAAVRRIGLSFPPQFPIPDDLSFSLS